MTKKEITTVLNEMCGFERHDTLTDLLQLAKFVLNVKALSAQCYNSIYQVETLCYKVQAEYCEEWATLIEWEKVEHTRDYTYYYIGNLSVVVEAPY